MDQSADSIAEYAAQTGRLDFLTVALTVTTTLLASVAILLALASLPFFFYVKRRAEHVAREASAKAIEGVEGRAEAAAISKMERMLPILWEEYREIAQYAASGEMADEIAGAQDDQPPDAVRDDQEGAEGGPR